jgi:hypothetical protein
MGMPVNREDATSKQAEKKVKQESTRKKIEDEILSSEKSFQGFQRNLLIFLRSNLESLAQKKKKDKLTAL